MNAPARYIRRTARPLIALAIASCVAMASGCAYYVAPVVPPQGLIFTNVKAPISVNYDKTKVGSAAAKSGSKQTSYLRDFIFTGLSFAWDDVAIKQIAAENNIQEVSYAEYESFLILGIFGTFKVTVYGN